MAVSLGPVSDPGAEMTLLEINQELQSQLEQSKQDFRDLKQKFLVSESTAYILANQLQKYKSGACKDIIESVLGEKLQFQEGKPTEKSTLAEKLKKYDVLIQDQARELAQLRQTIEKGREVSVLLKQHLRNLLTHDDPTNFQGQGFQERLAEGRRLVKRLARKLSPENHAEEENKEEKASMDPSLSTELQEKESVNEALKGSVDEGPVTSSSHQYPSGSHEPPSTNVFLSEEHEDFSALVAATEYSHQQEKKAPTGLPETQKDQKDEERDEPTAPSWELQEEEEMDDACQDSLDEKYLALSSHHDLSDSCHPPDSPTIPSDEHEICSRLDGAQTQKDQKDEDRDEPTAPSWELQEEEEMDDACQDSLDEKYLALSSHHDLSDSCHPPDSPTIPSDEHEICSRLDGAQTQKDQKDEDRDEPTAPSWELQEEEEMDDACQDSLDEKYLALSSHHDLSDSCHPPDSPTIPSDEHEICSRLDGAQTQKDQKDEDRDEPTAPSWELQEEEEMDDACQDSLDEKYLALSSHHDLSDSCHPPDSPTIPSDEHEICSRLDGAQTQKDQKDEDRDEPTAPSWELQEEEEMDDACQDSLDEKYLALSSHHDLSDSCHPPDSPTIPSDEHEICSRLDGAQTQKDQKDEDRDEPTAPR
ncbi:putative NBPF family member NBPF7 [Equus przewalskii]|uniref:NBPF family member NBPF7 n=1 Tax=Equus przewalskii TaxID=9798 RepID=A0ABM4Q0W5_EQUPR